MRALLNRLGDKHKRHAMKFLTIIIGALLLVSCSSMGSSGGSNSARTGSSDSDKPYSQRPFNPDDPYHGG